MKYFEEQRKIRYNIAMYKNLENALYEIILEDPRYKVDAYEFVLNALSFTQKKFSRLRHVTGEELLEGIKILLMEKFGPMTLTVLEHWGVHATEDFGNIVFNLVHKRVLSQTEEDNIQNFKNGFDFEKVFSKGYRRRLEQKISRMR